MDFLHYHKSQIISKPFEFFQTPKTFGVFSRYLCCVRISMPSCVLILVFTVVVVTSWSHASAQQIVGEFRFDDEVCASPYEYRVYSKHPNCHPQKCRADEGKSHNITCSSTLPDLVTPGFYSFFAYRTPVRSCNILTFVNAIFFSKELVAQSFASEGKSLCAPGYGDSSFRMECYSSSHFSVSYCPSENCEECFAPKKFSSTVECLQVCSLFDDDELCNAEEKSHHVSFHGCGENGLGAGIIAIIVVLSVGAVVLIGAAVWAYWKRHSDFTTIQ